MAAVHAQRRITLEPVFRLRPPDEEEQQGTMRLGERPEVWRTYFDVRLDALMLKKSRLRFGRNSFCLEKETQVVARA